MNRTDEPQTTHDFETQPIATEETPQLQPQPARDEEDALNTLDDTWYTYPQGVPFSVTKMALATEELYFAWRRSIGKPCPPGLA
jgi:hypothetical protein